MKKKYTAPSVMVGVMANETILAGSVEIGTASYKGENQTLLGRERGNAFGEDSED